MLAGSAPAERTKPVRRQRGPGLAPELDVRAAEKRVRQSSTKEEAELAEEHLRLLHTVELSGPARTTWAAVTTYMVLIVAFATSRVASALGLDEIISPATAKVSYCRKIRKHGMHVCSFDI